MTSLRFWVKRSMFKVTPSRRRCTALDATVTRRYRRVQLFLVNVCWVSPCSGLKWNGRRIDWMVLCSLWLWSQIDSVLGNWWSFCSRDSVVKIRFIVVCCSGVYELQLKAFVGRAVITGPQLLVSIQPDATKPVSFNISYKPQDTYTVGAVLPGNV